MRATALHVDTIEERLCQFRAMSDHAGVDLLAMAAGREDELRAAAQLCLGCRAGEECREWLGAVEPEAPPPGFCRNADTLGEWAVQLSAVDDGMQDD
ncbi:DUF6455 family protein [Starkeya koreensis]|uniref:DUF6455 family protein n=1 Tax=Ancylobacter koreensis TaxID=266121 RepID=A0ABT0DS05_9HYPH|nr:DUF6455 family protein [Ancylobacter koreensis]MCK0210053.1 DUF6455 family protein [Ancylobacter koreensis]